MWKEGYFTYLSFFMCSCLSLLILNLFLHLKTEPVVIILKYLVYVINLVLFETRYTTLYRELNFYEGYKK